MDFVSLDQKIGEAGKEKIRNTHLFEADNFRSWMLYFEQGDSTPMHLPPIPRDLFGHRRQVHRKRT